jgi:hypothetical protein
MRDICVTRARLTIVSAWRPRCLASVHILPVFDYGTKSNRLTEIDSQNSGPSEADAFAGGGGVRAGVYIQTACTSRRLARKKQLKVYEVDLYILRQPLRPASKRKHYKVESRETRCFFVAAWVRYAVGGSGSAVVWQTTDETRSKQSLVVCQI